jgi:hypothetical protein
MSRTYIKTVAWTDSPKRMLTLWFITEVRKARAVVKFTSNFQLTEEQKEQVKTIMLQAEQNARLEYEKRKALL